MGQLEVKQKKDERILVYKIKKPEARVDTMVNWVNGKYKQLFLPITVQEDKKGNDTFFVNVSHYANLFATIKNGVTEDFFFFILSQVVDILCFCENHNINTVNLELSYYGVYIDPRSNRVKFAYWPIINNENPHDVQKFMRRLANTARFSGGESLGRYDQCRWYIINAKNGFSIKVFRKYLHTLLKDQTSDKGEKAGESGSTKKDLYFNPLDTGSGNDENKNEGKKQQGEAHLMRTKTGEIITIDKPTFQIGRSKETTDYCINDNPTISKVHAVISQRDGRFFLKDLKSSNHTFVHGEQIQGDMEAELVSGMKFLLSNEEFEFRIY